MEDQTPLAKPDRMRFQLVVKPGKHEFFFSARTFDEAFEKTKVYLRRLEQSLRAKGFRKRRWALLFTRDRDPFVLDMFEISPEFWK